MKRSDIQTLHKISRKGEAEVLDVCILAGVYFYLCAKWPKLPRGLIRYGGLKVFKRASDVLMTCILYVHSVVRHHGVMHMTHFVTSSTKSTLRLFVIFSAVLVDQENTTDFLMSETFVASLLVSFIQPKDGMNLLANFLANLYLRGI